MEVVWSLAILMCLVKLYLVNAHKAQSGIQLSEEFTAWISRIKVFVGAADAPQGGQPNYYQEHLVTYEQV